MAKGDGRLLLLLLLVVDFWALCSSNTAPMRHVKHAPLPQGAATVTLSTAEPSYSAPITTASGVSVIKAGTVSTGRGFVLTRAKGHRQERSVLTNLKDVLKHLRSVSRKGRSRDSDAVQPLKTKRLSWHTAQNSRSVLHDLKNSTTKSAQRSTYASLKPKRIYHFLQSNNDTNVRQCRWRCLDSVLDMAYNDSSKPRPRSVAKVPNSSDGQRPEMTQRRKRQKQTKRKSNHGKRSKQISQQTDKHDEFPERESNSVLSFEKQINAHIDMVNVNQITRAFDSRITRAFDVRSFQRHREVPRIKNEPAANPLPPELSETPNGSKTNDQKIVHTVSVKDSAVGKCCARRLPHSKRQQNRKEALERVQGPRNKRRDQAAGTGNVLPTDDGTFHDIKTKMQTYSGEEHSKTLDSQQAFEADDDQRQPQTFDPEAGQINDFRATGKKYKTRTPLQHRKTLVTRGHSRLNATHFQHRFRQGGKSDSDDKQWASSTEDRSTQMRAALAQNSSQPLLNRLADNRPKKPMVKRSFTPRGHADWSMLLSTPATQVLALLPGQHRRPTLMKSPDWRFERVAPMSEDPAFSEQFIASDPLLLKASLHQGDSDSDTRNRQDQARGGKYEPELQSPNLMTGENDSSDKTAQNSVQVAPWTFAEQSTVDVKREPVDLRLAEAFLRAREKDEHPGIDSFQKLRKLSETHALQPLNGDEDKQKPFDDGTLFLPDDHAVELLADELQTVHKVPSHLVSDTSGNNPWEQETNEELDQVSQGRLQVSSSLLFREPFNVQKTADKAVPKPWQSDPDKDRISVGVSSPLLAESWASQPASLTETRVMAPHETARNKPRDAKNVNTPEVLHNTFSGDGDTEQSIPKVMNTNVSDTSRRVWQRTKLPKHVREQHLTRHKRPEKLPWEDQDDEGVMNVLVNATHFLNCMLRTSHTCRWRLKALVPSSPTPGDVHSVQLVGTSNRKPDEPTSGRRSRRQFSGSKNRVDLSTETDDLPIVQKRQRNEKGPQGPSGKKSNTGVSYWVTESDQTVSGDLGLTPFKTHRPVRSLSKHPAPEPEHLRHGPSRQKKHKRRKHPRRVSRKRTPLKRTDFHQTITLKNFNLRPQQYRAKPEVKHRRYGRTHEHEPWRKRKLRIHTRSVRGEELKGLLYWVGRTSGLWTPSRFQMPAWSARGPGQAGTLLDLGNVKSSASRAKPENRKTVPSSVIGRMFFRPDRPELFRTEALRPLAAKDLNITFFDSTAKTTAGKLNSLQPAVYDVPKPTGLTDKLLDNNDMAQSSQLASGTEAELNPGRHGTADRAGADQTAGWNEREGNLDLHRTEDQSRPRRSWEPVTNAISCSPIHVQHLTMRYRENRPRNREPLCPSVCLFVCLSVSVSIQIRYNTLCVCNLNFLETVWSA